jgi:hypothetical protein
MGEYEWLVLGTVATSVLTLILVGLGILFYCMEIDDPVLPMFGFAIGFGLGAGAFCYVCGSYNPPRERTTPIYSSYPL